MKTQNRTIRDQMRKAVSTHFYNIKHPEAYSREEIIDYENQIDSMMQTVNYYIDKMLKQPEKQEIEIAEELDYTVVAFQEVEDNRKLIIELQEAVNKLLNERT